MRPTLRTLLLIWVAFSSVTLCAQKSPPADSLRVSRNELERPFLWKPFQIHLQVSGGTVPYHWRIVEGPVPRNIFLNDDGMLTGVLNEPAPFQFTVLIRDNSSPPKQQKQQYVLRAEIPLTIDWKDKARIDGQRIDGSVTASNNTGRDLDLTFIVLAVNDIGRATAIGYQHFPLKSDTKNMEIPFGDTLSPGNYEVNVDVVGEEPISNSIFRTRLVAEKKAITQGP